MEMEMENKQLGMCPDICKAHWAGQIDAGVWLEEIVHLGSTDLAFALIRGLDSIIGPEPTPPLPAPLDRIFTRRLESGDVDTDEEGCRRIGVAIAAKDYLRSVFMAADKRRS
jgi:hypothetical protein